MAMMAWRARAACQDPLVSGVIALLIILGGLGFLVQLNLLTHVLNPRVNRLLVYSKLTLSTTAALLLLGAAGSAHSAAVYVEGADAGQTLGTATAFSGTSPSPGCHASGGTMPGAT